MLCVHRTNDVLEGELLVSHCDRREISQKELLSRTFQASRRNPTDTYGKDNASLLMRCRDVGRVYAQWLLERHVIFNNYENVETY